MLILGSIYSLIVISGRFEFKLLYGFISDDLKFNMTLYYFEKIVVCQVHLN